jgi:hypothetical protein
MHRFDTLYSECRDSNAADSGRDSAAPAAEEPKWLERAIDPQLPTNPNEMRLSRSAWSSIRRLIMLRILRLTEQLRVVPPRKHFRLR